MAKKQLPPKPLPNGRPSALSDAQWEKIFKRLLKGEKAIDIAREVGVSKGLISQRFSKRMAHVKEAARDLADAEAKLSAMTLPDQIVTRSLADELKAVSMHLISAGSYGARIAHRMNAIAHEQAQKVDDAEPSKSMGALQNIAVLTKIANSSAEIGLKLLGANRMQEEPPPPPEAPKLDHIPAKELEAMKKRLYATSK
jgi:AcrR family transcriptional regulator